LEQRIFVTVYEETEMNSVDDIEGFTCPLAGISTRMDEFCGVQMNTSKNRKLADLSAYRNDAAIGTATINRFLHEKYRSQQAQN
jgi:hypothetical protein